MEGHEKELIIAQISAGYIRCRLDETVVVKHPTADLEYEAQEIYQDTYTRAVNEGLLNDEDLLLFLIKHDLWDDKKTDNLENILPKHIEHWQIEIFKSAFKQVQREKNRQYLVIAREEYERLTNIRHSLDHYSAHGVAHLAKWTHIIENSTYYPNHTPYNWEKLSVSTVLNTFQSKMASDIQLREVAKTDPWQTTWLAQKKNGKIFPNDRLTLEQKRLIMWSNMYDSISESMDCPEKEVVDDDDALDGWLALQRKERESEHRKKSVEGKFAHNEKISNADEVFIVADSISDARKIDSANDPHSRAIKRQRFKQIEDHGNVHEHELADVKMNRQMNQNQAYINSRKS